MRRNVPASLSPYVSLLLLVAATLVFNASAGDVKIAWSVKTQSLSAAPGARITITLEGTIPDGYHTYSPKTAAEYGDATIPILPTKFELDPTSLLSLDDKVTYPPPTMKKEELTGILVETFEKSVTYTIPVRISKDAKSGEHTATLKVKSQVCKRQCFESLAELAIPVKVTASSNSLTFELPGLGAKRKPAEKKSIDWKLSSETISAARGQTVNVEITGAIPAGYHAYTAKTAKEFGDENLPITPTTFEIAPPDLAKLNGPITSKNAKPYVERSSNRNIEVLEGMGDFTVPLQISKDAKPGEHTLQIDVTSQLCTEENCLIPETKSLTVKLTVTDAPVVNEAPVTKATASKVPDGTSGKGLGSNDDIKKAKDEGLLPYLWLSMTMGGLALLTPCVFPMIPITVSFFTKRKQVSRSQTIRDAGVYALGIILTFVVLGFAVTLLMGASGVQNLATHPVSNLLIFIIFTALALSLFGAFEIQLPTSILNRLNAKANEGDGVASVLMMGLVFTLTSFTCTVPFIGATLISATRGDFFWPMVGMVGFATTFSLPFVVLALVPSWIKSLPKSGGWLNSVKVVMGFIELAAAMKFASNIDLAFGWGVITRDVFLSGWVALALLSTYYLLGRFQMTHDTPVERIGGVRTLLAAGFLTIAIFLASGLNARPLGEIDAFLPPDPYPGTTSVKPAGKESGGDELSWHETLEAGLAEAKASNKRVFVDFTGYLCTNCRLMEKNVFPKPEVHDLLKQYVRVQLYTDGSGAKAESSARNRELQQKRYDTAALPFYVILTADDQFVDSFPGFTRDVKEFADFLRNGLTREPAKK
ncbi:MAG TPA: protein-disulfide reductase DsbD domain-containing protein [Planctomycetota bacterium]|nr:protein-disulfide reductase DsbD domain-containing protein [Planctomycetota bacterium]